MKIYCVDNQSICYENSFIYILYRESGICPIREELHAQCFDEIIRQVTLNCAERGFTIFCKISYEIYKVCFLWEFEMN